MLAPICDTATPAVYSQPHWTASDCPRERASPRWLAWNSHPSYTFPETWGHAPSGDMAHLHPRTPVVQVPKERACRRAQPFQGPHDDSPLSAEGRRSWHYYVTMPMPASTFTVAVGAWTEVRPETCGTEDVVAERGPSSPPDADQRFVFVNGLENTLAGAEQCVSVFPDGACESSQLRSSAQTCLARAEKPLGGRGWEGSVRAGRGREEAC